MRTALAIDGNADPSQSSGTARAKASVQPSAPMSVQDGNLADRNPSTGPPVTVREFFQFAVNRLRLNYIFRGVEEAFYTSDILPFLRALPKGGSRFMSRTTSAVVLGASGSVGNALIKELIRNGSFTPVVSLARRSRSDQVAVPGDAGVELREVLVPTMTPAALDAATSDVIRSLDGDVVGFSVLGVGADTAKLTIDQHRAIDVQLNAAFARALRASGRVKHLAFMSAVGADPTASATGSGAAGMARYARVKGEAEEAVKESGPSVVSIFRPAMIIGSQHTPWLLGKVLPALSFMTPAKYRSITVEQIAKAMIAASLKPPAQSAVYHYSEMMALNRQARSNSVRGSV